jgi:hypothetical protein
MKSNIYPLKQLEIPMSIVERDGPFDEFKKDASFITVELNDGAKVNGVLLLYPNYVIAVEGCTDLPFSPADVVKAYQTNEDLKRRSKSSWSFFYDPEEFRTGG